VVPFIEKAAPELMLCICDRGPAGQADEGTLFFSCPVYRQFHGAHAVCARRKRATYICICIHINLLSCALPPFSFVRPPIPDNVCNSGRLDPGGSGAVLPVVSGARNRIRGRGRSGHRHG
jgi:hypothetical protein